MHHPDALRDLGVRVDPAVAQDGSWAHRLDRAEIAVDQQVLLAVRRRARDHAPERIGDERLAPEADAVLAPDAVTAATNDAVRDRVARCTVSQASCCACRRPRPSSNCQPIAVG